MFYIKKGMIFLFMILSIVVSAQTVVNGSIDTDVNTRTYRIYIPEKYDGSEAVPLVLNFHGYGSANWQQEIYGDFRPIADTANFIIVHPQGTNLNGTTGFNNFSTVAAANAEIEFIEGLLDTLSTLYNIDQNRIFSTGMSNGGFMSYDLACFLSNRIAAIASVTGSMVLLHQFACNPTRPVPVLQIHGTADQVVTYNGSGGLIPSVHIDSLVKYWLKENNITAPPVITSLPDINTADNSTVEHYLYTGGTSGSTVELYKVIGGGHTWPGSLINTGTGNTNRDFSASVAIWNFFRQHTLQGAATSTIIADPVNDQFIIYADPAGKGIILNLLEPKEADVRIYNTSGALVYEGTVRNIHSTINLNEPAGIYLYQVRLDDKLYSGKLAKY